MEQVNTIEFATLPTDKELVLKVISMPKDCNASGHIFGGWVMSQVDLAGSVLPSQYCGARVVTVAVNQFIFKQPVHVGELLSFYAKIVRIGNTSITVEVEVFAQGREFKNHWIRVTEATLTYVHLDSEGKPAKVTPTTDL